MIQYELLREQGILILRPEAALQSEDFAAVAKLVDPYIESHGDLRGLMIDAPSFPGWENFAALLSHLRFVRDHHRRIRRVAVVSDDPLLGVAPKIAGHFLSAELKTFAAMERAAALAWLGEGG
ncbi:MAG: STAS/SEC14 domain-containing protein [Burkholderiales bacterium]|nr:STAS/SEC14 domain-containing protein [Burkholderiales bacterium]